VIREVIARFVQEEKAGIINRMFAPAKQRQPQQQQLFLRQLQTSISEFLDQQQQRQKQQRQ